MRGLINYGTHCSINSIVQCLYETRELRDLILSVDEREYQAHNTVAMNLKALIREMKENDRLPCDPGFLIDSMSVYSGMSFKIQEDSDLVFTCIINALADGHRTGKGIGKLWDIECEEHMRCLSCNKVRSVLKNANSIPLLIDGALPNELQEYMKQYADNTRTACDWHCTNCHRKTKLEITSKVVSLPPVVCMKLGRVKNTGRDTAHIVKMGTRFAFPETVDLKYIMKGPEASVSAIYELYAVVAHCGTHYSGHYTAYLRCGIQGWYLADDAHVRLCSWADVQNTYEAGSNLYDRVAYMLMYHRKSSSH
ncbi:ubl carboxyl-terminal hydrolase 18-like [Esox lucius]|uniref:ubl carboxyl-terminal hydrolase 18-like n=1 Tax=Esox lucius TaxID=8010 RepID=UPI001476CC19|nr:ubl carboxyl-terminal hydrolase 18-like [Esox lucius]